VEWVRPWDDTPHHTLTLPSRPAWHARAACRGVGTIGFVDPRPGRDDVWRLDVCDGCPVRADCAAAALWALEHGTRLYGMWGGIVVSNRGRRRVIGELRAVVSKR
jgi:hypothetical protein